MRKLGFASVFLVFILSVHIFAQHVHVHGEGELHVVFEKDTMGITLNLPAESVIGFEHSPRTSKEFALVDNAKTQLTESNLFSLYTDGGFLRKDIKINPIPTDKKVTTSFHDGHAKFIITAQYPLPKKSVIAISTRVFAMFDNIHTIETTVLSPQFQTTAEWTHRQQKLSTKGKNS